MLLSAQMSHMGQVYFLSPSELMPQAVNSIKMKVLFAAVKSNTFCQLTLSGLRGNGCEYVQHIAQLAPILLGLSVLV